MHPLDKKILKDASMWAVLCLIFWALLVMFLTGCRPEDQVEGGGRPWPQEQTYLLYSPHSLPERPLNGSLTHTPRYWP